MKQGCNYTTTYRYYVKGTGY